MTDVSSAPPVDNDRYGARFVAEMLRLTERNEILSESRLKRLEELGFSQIAGALEDHLPWLTREWLARRRSVPPEELARSIVREQYTRSGRAPDFPNESVENPMASIAVGLVDLLFNALWLM